MLFQYYKESIPYIRYTLFIYNNNDLVSVNNDIDTINNNLTNIIHKTSGTYITDSISGIYIPIEDGYTYLSSIVTNNYWTGHYFITDQKIYLIILSYDGKPVGSEKLINVDSLFISNDAISNN